MSRKQQRQRTRKKSRRHARGTGAARAPATAGHPSQAYAPSAPIAAVLQQAFTFHQSGRPEEALELYRQVLAAEPNHVDALNFGGVAAFQSGDAKQGVKLLRAAVARKPDYVDAYNNLGNVLRALGRLDRAEAAYRRALKIEPDYADAHYNLGVLLESVGRLDEATAAYRRCVEIKPDFSAAHFNLGNALKPLGRLDETVAAYGRALELVPGNADAHNNLGSALFELGKLDDAAAACRRALAIDPSHADAHYNLGVALQERGKLDDAVAAYRSALAIKPDYAPAHVNLGYALKQSGKLDEAVTAYRRAIAIEPDYAMAHTNLGDVLLERGEPRAAVGVCDAFLTDHPGDSGVLAFKAIALDELGDRASVRFLVDFDRFIRVTKIDAAAGFASLADFNAALARHVCAHPTLFFAPTRHATRSGRHSGELLVEPKGPVAELERMIRRAVEDYARSLPAEAAHPFVASRPRHLALTAWGVVLEAQGHQIPHNHPTAWLSGVYYVKVPDAVSTLAQGQAGWIEFGRPPDHYHSTVEPEVRAFRPEEGLMLLFPSYFYHRTVPFEAAGTRISIAFDARPLE